MQWYLYNKTQLAGELGVDLETGLTDQSAKERLIKNGLNQLPEKPVDSWIKIFCRQFQSPLIYVLFVCAVVVYFLGDSADAVIILFVLLCNALIGVVQEGRAGKVFQSLKKLSQAEVTVLRNETEQIIPEVHVVVGDVLVLNEGQKIPADARVIFSNNLVLDESTFTGETGGILKKDTQLTENNLPVSAQHNMVFKGTSILSGNGLALVASVGKETELGKISSTLLLKEEEIPLQKNLRLFSKMLVWVVFGFSILLFFFGLYSGRKIREMFSLVVSLAVSVIPEGLPLVLTVILASGVWRMSKRNALVKKLQAVETLGQAKIIAVDKTGTITENQMIVKQVYIGDKNYLISGNGYEPKGEIRLGNENQKENSDIMLSAIIASLSSKALVKFDESSGVYRVIGDPTEAAMAVFGQKAGYEREKQFETYREVGEIPFDYKNKFRAVFFEHDDTIFCAVSGAPEILLKHSGHFLENGQARVLTNKDKENFESTIEEYSSKAFRVVAFGFKHLSKTHTLDNINDLVFGGFFGIEDMVRPEAKHAVEKAQAEGVKVVMITGDLKTTAKSIAKEAGIYKDGDIMATGPELSLMSEQELDEKLPRISLFARVTPEDKMKIIKAYKRSGLIVAMTGDGVNDAPSLVAADLGVAMGKIGTEVAKEAADIVLLDDNLGSIVSAIKEGRVMYQNIKKSLQFLFSTSLGEVFTIIAALVLQMPVLPILAIQILWLNLITDPLTAASLALEKEEGGVSVKRNKYFIDKAMFAHIIVVASVMMLGALYFFNLYLPMGYEKATTVALTVLAAFQWFNGFNCRYLEHSLFRQKTVFNKYLWISLGVNVALQVLAVYTPFMQKILKTSALGWKEWVLAFACGIGLIFIEEIRKLVFRFFTKSEKVQV